LATPHPLNFTRKISQFRIFPLLYPIFFRTTMFIHSLFSCAACAISPFPKDFSADDNGSGWRKKDGKQCTGKTLKADMVFL